MLGRKKNPSKLTALFAVVAAALLLQGAAFGAYRYDSTEIPYAPVYVRWLGPDSPEDPQWFSFIFYRSRDVIPPLFNLLDLIDFGAFAHPLLVEGFQIFMDEFDPDNPAPPFYASLREITEVPIWFISVDDWVAATTVDTPGILTIGELEGLPSLMKGSASFYKELFQPASDPFPEGGAKVPKFDCLARGTLEENDGNWTTFRLQYIEVSPKNKQPWMVPVYSIKFK